MTRVLIPSDRVAVVGAIKPDAHVAAAYTSGWVPAKNFARFMAIFGWGTLGAGATIAGIIQQATDSSGTGAKAVTGAAITTATQAVSPADDEQQAIINLNTEDLDTANGFDYIRLSMTVGVNTSDAMAILLGLDPRYGPASDNDASTVKEIVTVGTA